jgi:hypothetical protein
LKTRRGVLWDVSFWPIASFAASAQEPLLSERSGHGDGGHGDGLDIAQEVDRSLSQGHCEVRMRRSNSFVSFPQARWIASLALAMTVRSLSRMMAAMIASDV